MSAFEYYFPENPRYRCCCQCCHVRTGTVAIAIVSFLITLYFFIKGLVFLGRGHEEYRTSSLLSVIAAAFFIVICILLLVGTYRKIRLLLLPYLMVQALAIVVSFAMGVLCVTYLVTGKAELLGPTGAIDQEPRKYATTHESSLLLKVLVAVTGGVFWVIFFLGIWFFMVVLHCFRWMKEKQTYHDNQRTLMREMMVPSSTTV